MRKQKGGRTVMSGEYYGRDSGRYGPNNNTADSSAYGKVYATSHGSQIKNNLLGPDLGPYPNNTSIRTGGGEKKCYCKCNCRDCKDGVCICPKNQCYCNEQKGGTVLPIEYFGRDSGRYGPNNNTNSSAYGKVYATSHGSQIKNNLLGPDLGPYPNNTSIRTGGGVKNCKCNCNCSDCKDGVCICTKNKCYCNKKGGSYSKIINPATGRKVNLSSKLGKQILNNYLRMLY